jgi:hypothetical protein
MGQYPVSPAIITPAVLRGPFMDSYEETDGTYTSNLVDDTDPPTALDSVKTHLLSPSQPTNTSEAVAPGLGDDGFIDVEILVP